MIKKFSNLKITHGKSFLYKYLIGENVCDGEKIKYARRGQRMGIVSVCCRS